MQYEESDAWSEYDEDYIETAEEEEKDGKKVEMELKDDSEIVEKERKDIEAKSEIIDDIDMLPNFMMEFEAKRMKELAIKAEETRKQLRHLIGVT